MYLIWLAMFSGNGFGWGGNNGAAAANSMTLQDIQKT